MEPDVPLAAAQDTPVPASHDCAGRRRVRRPNTPTAQTASHKNNMWVIVSDQLDELPIMEREIQLVAAYLGDQINQILSEPR